MTTDQKDHFNMFLKVQTFLVNNETALAVLAIVGTLQIAFGKIIDAIVVAEGDASEDISGSTELKRMRQDAVKLQALKVARAATLYFTLSEDPVTLRKIDLLKSELDSMRDTDLYVRVKKLFEICDPVKALIDAPDFVPADVTQLDSLNEKYFEVLEAPQDARSLRSSYNQEVDRQLALGQLLLKDKLDVAMATFEASNKQLYDYYLSARRIDNTGSRNELSGFDIQTKTIAGNGSIVFGPVPEVDMQVYIANGGPSSIVICETATAADSCSTGNFILPEDEYLGTYSGLGISGGNFVVVTNTGAMQVTVKLGTKKL